MENNIYHVYLLTNKQRHNIYVGLTNNLTSCVREQAFKVLPKLLGESLCTRLVYFESYRDGTRAEVRKTQLRRASLCKKFALIERANPGWCRLEQHTEFAIQSANVNQLPV